MPSARSFLLPVLGAVAAIVAFKIAAPYEGTLERPGMGLDDPRALFTYGTDWGAANRIAFGSLICGMFCLALTAGRRSAPRALLACVLGVVLGAAVNYLTDSAADVIGIFLTNPLGKGGSLVAMLAWCILVPTGISLSIAYAMGITAQRLKRALFASRVAGFASLAVQIGGSVLAAGGAGTSLQSQIPVWRNVEIAVGIALGLTIAIADEVIRLGSIRLVHGRNEFKDWSLDYPVNRIGSGEECEIPLKGFKGVERVHALLVKQGGHFFLDPKAATSVNGVPVASPIALNAGDRIAVGDANLVFYVRGFRRAVHQPAVQPQPTWVAPVPVAPTLPTRLLVDKAGQEVRLPPGRYGVGRDVQNAFCLNNDTSISRYHAEFVATDVGLSVTDLGSKNGTILNGARLYGKADLKPGDVVQFGASQFTYRG